MNCIQDVFRSPEYFALRMDFALQLVSFVHMSPEAYRKSVFLDTRVRCIDSERHVLRLDDLLLAADRVDGAVRPIHYILHPAFCCSTLLARYFELMSNCLVLKEPLLLTQLAVNSRELVPKWDETLDLCVSLLGRTYSKAQSVIIKAHEPCNSLGLALLRRNPSATVIFLTTPLRHFLLSVLKAGDRRHWVRQRACAMLEGRGENPALEDVMPTDLTDAQAAACMWAVNHSLCEQLATSRERSRVFVTDSDQLLAFPQETLQGLVRFCHLRVDEDTVAWMVAHPSIRKYSKDVSRSYDAAARCQELAELERRFGHEADLGVEWAARHSVSALAVL